VSDEQGETTFSRPVTVSVVPDPLTTVSGRLVAADGNPVTNAEVTVTLNGLRAEFFDYASPLSTLPEVNGTVAGRTGYVSAVNVRNPDGLFGSDPFGVGMAPDYAARYSGFLSIDEPGEYTFVLGADEGARLALAGLTVLQMPTGRGEFQAFSRTVQLPAGLIPIELTFYESYGDAELQLSYARPGADVEVVPPERFRAVAGEYTIRTDSAGRFVIPNVPANVAAIRLSDRVSELSAPVPPVPGGTTDLGDVVVER
jgi:hypothetical protein